MDGKKDILYSLAEGDLKIEDFISKLKYHCTEDARDLDLFCVPDSNLDKYVTSCEAANNGESRVPEEKHKIMEASATLQPLLPAAVFDPPVDENIDISGSIYVAEDISEDEGPENEDSDDHGIPEEN